MFTCLLLGLIVPGLFALIDSEVGARKRGPRGRVAATAALIAVVAISVVGTVGTNPASTFSTVASYFLQGLEA